MWTVNIYLQKLEGVMFDVHLRQTGEQLLPVHILHILHDQTVIPARCCSKAIDKVNDDIRSGIQSDDIMKLTITHNIK